MGGAPSDLRRWRIMIGEGSALQTVDPRYQSWLRLVGMLMSLKVIDVTYAQHGFSFNIMMTGNHKIPGHWIPMAIVSLKAEYVEVIPIARKNK